MRGRKRHRKKAAKRLRLRFAGRRILARPWYAAANWPFVRAVSIGWEPREGRGVMRGGLLVVLLVAVASIAHALDVPRPTPTIINGMLVCPECPRFSLADPLATPTPEPPTGNLCGPLSFQVKDPARCAVLGKAAPCFVRCGRLCWRKGRKTWELLGCEPLGALLAPSPTPVPTATPRPTASPRPSPTPTRTPAPGPTMNACDRGERDWCYYWRTGKCTHPCPVD